jgi:hypothetical protein
MVVGAIATLAALLLFGGGTTSWRVLANSSKAKPGTSSQKPKKPRDRKSKEKQSRRRSAVDKDESASHHHKPKPPHPPSPPPPPPCKGEAAVSHEYCDRGEITNPAGESTLTIETNEGG